jgi:hypothetical protein
MERTQLYLDRDLQRTLQALAAREGSTLSEVLRDRLRKALADEGVVDPLRAVDEAVGAWSERTESVTDYLRRLRKSTRPGRHGQAQERRRRR